MTGPMPKKTAGISMVPVMKETKPNVSARMRRLSGLVNKRVWAHVRDSKANRFEQGGFASGFYEGERVLA